MKPTPKQYVCTRCIHNFVAATEQYEVPQCPKCGDTEFIDPKPTFNDFD